MPDFDQLKHFPQAAKLINDPERLNQWKNAPETQRIFALLSQNTSGSLEQAAGKAAQGDTQQLVSAIRRLMTDPEGAQLLEKMKEKLT